MYSCEGLVSPKITKHFAAVTSVLEVVVPKKQGCSDEAKGLFAINELWLKCEKEVGNKNSINDNLEERNGIVASILKPKSMDVDYVFSLEVSVNS